MTSRKRISRAGPRSGADGPDGVGAASAPARPHDAARDAAPAATGAAAPSRAQLSPPNAIALVPTATCAKTTSAAEVEAARQRRRRRAPRRRRRSRRSTMSRLQTSGFSRRPRGLGTAGRAGACGGRRSAPSPSPRARTGAAPWPRADPRPGDRRIRRAAGRARTSSVLRSRPDRALAQQPVGGQPRAGQDERRPPREREEDGRRGSGRRRSGRARPR